MLSKAAIAWLEHYATKSAFAVDRNNAQEILDYVRPHIQTDEYNKAASEGLKATARLNYNPTSRYFGEV